MLVSMLYTIVNAWTVINDEIYSEYIVIHVQVCVCVSNEACCAYTVMFCVCVLVCVFYFGIHICV